MHGSIVAVDDAEWNALAGSDDFYESHEWLAAIERDRTARPCYIVARCAGRLVGGLPLYRVSFEGSSFYQPERLRALLGVAGDYLIAGTRRGYRSDVLLAPDLPEAVRRRIAGFLLRTALDEAGAAGMSGVVLPYLSTPALELAGSVAPVTAAFDGADCILDGIGNGIGAYLDQLSSKRRTKVCGEMHRFAGTGWRIQAAALADCLPEVASLVSEVERRHGHAMPDALLRRVFRREVAAVGHRAAVLSCHAADAIVACAVRYVWRDTLYSRAIGLDYDRIRGTFAYFNLLVYESVRYAAERGLDRLMMGLATAPKLERGAIARPLWTAVLRTDDADLEPCVRIVDRDAMRRWSEPYRCYPRAFPADVWVQPGS
jgi:uncharacterized protein